MTHCSKCGAELIGSRKFCIACGAPAIDPRTDRRITGTLPSAYAPLSDRVSSSNASPRASTAPQSEPPKEPQSKHDSLVQERVSDYGPPPTPHLAAAATDSSRVAQGIAADETTSQTLVSARLPSSVINAAMNRRRNTLPIPMFTPQTRPSPPSQPAPSSSSMAAQPSGQTSTLAAGPNTYSNYPPQGISAPMPSSHNLGFGPGTRVQVAWADGRSYPGMVQHVNGAVYLVMFPDGQQLWIDRQYLAPI
jgi:hypothetical protein